VAEVDSSLVVDVLTGHVVLADLIVEAAAGAADRRHHIIARHELRNVVADFQHPAETFVTDHEKVVTGRRLAIFRCVDLFVRAIDADAQHLHQDATSVRDLMDRGFG
jgi:hypothetical protein